MKATIVYDAASRLAIAACATLEDVAPALRRIERATGEKLDREELAVEEGVHLVNELQSSDEVVVDNGLPSIELDGFEFQYAVRRKKISPREACDLAKKDVELVEDRELGYHVLRWDENTRSWKESESTGFVRSVAERRHYSAVRALELMGARRVEAENAVAAVMQTYRFNRVLPVVRIARRALAI
ncbi:MAG: hypothetical protein CMQ40_10845 [Gammaproteobacteria bacterium]|nr:hypothetical protein [Gammaproteobacteria bacterium]